MSRPNQRLFHHEFHVEVEIRVDVTQEVVLSQVITCSQQIRQPENVSHIIIFYRRIVNCEFHKFTWYYIASTQDGTCTAHYCIEPEHFVSA